MKKRKSKFLVFILLRIRKQKGPLVGAIMIAGDIVIQNGGFLAVHYTTYHFGQVKSFAKAIGRIFRRIPRKIKRKK